jgi:trimeric autotransporter adhesin
MVLLGLVGRSVRKRVTMGTHSVLPVCLSAAPTHSQKGSAWRGALRPWRKLAIACACCCAAGVVRAQMLVISSPGQIDITAPADSLSLPGPYYIGIANFPGMTAPGFQYIGTSTPSGTPDFLIVSPSSGAVPPSPESALVWVALNPEVVPYMPTREYIATLQFAATGQTTPSADVTVTLTLGGARPVIQSILNAATLQPAISPGEIVSIFGTHIGTAPVTGHYNGAGVYPTDLSHQTVPYSPDEPPDGVTFNGVAAPLLYYSSNQINAIVPYELAGQSSVNVVVTHNDNLTPAFTLPVSATTPGIFTAGQSGSGQGAILNADGTPNSASNPAAPGSAISIFAIGTGVPQQSVPDGSVLFGGGATCPNTAVSTSCKPQKSTSLFFPTAPVSLTIGGQPALLQYVGPSPGSAAALTQINALVPTGIGPGPQPVVLTVGQNNNAQQQVTVAVQ